ncbi:MAG: hypothetical protein JJV97_00155 [SAR324 cluster bacterium]|nr:hypothetical protein [SAR324 cluster bacterium]
MVNSLFLFLCKARPAVNKPNFLPALAPTWSKLTFLSTLLSACISLKIDSAAPAVFEPIGLSAKLKRLGDTSLKEGVSIFFNTRLHKSGAYIALSLALNWSLDSFLDSAL